MTIEQKLKRAPRVAPELEELRRSLLSEEEVICLTPDAYALALSVGLMLLQHCDFQVAKVTKGF